MVNIGDILGKSMGNKKVEKEDDCKRIPWNFSCSRIGQNDWGRQIVQEAKKSTEDNGIVFLDEIDKVSARGDRVGGDVSRENYKEIFFH